MAKSYMKQPATKKKESEWSEKCTFGEAWYFNKHSWFTSLCPKIPACYITELNSPYLKMRGNIALWVLMLMLKLRITIPTWKEKFCLNSLENHHLCLLCMQDGTCNNEKYLRFCGLMVLLSGWATRGPLKNAGFSLFFRKEKKEKCQRGNQVHTTGSKWTQISFWQLFCFCLFFNCKC